MGFCRFLTVNTLWVYTLLLIVGAIEMIEIGGTVGGATEMTEIEGEGGHRNT